MVARIAEINSYHAHVYFDDEMKRRDAETLRGLIAERFAVQLGRWHEQPVGPHETGMYQIAFGTELFSRLVPWLMLNRAGLSILVHPNTANARRDHLVHALWLGAPLMIMHAEQLPETMDAGDHAVPVANTDPTIAP